RGVSLLVLPTPVKPALEPHRFSTRAAADSAPLRNPSFDEFKSRLAAAGIPLFDPAPRLAQVGRETGRPQYLATDTHWTPDAVDQVARRLAAVVDGMVELSPAGPAAWVRREVEVEGAGDVAVMLKLPPDQSIYSTQHLTIQQVSTWDGAPWRSDPKAEVLLLGDSFTNVYSEPGLGWGSGAGLAEQLTYYLQRPVDRLARNAGGAHATREALQRALAAGEDRLAGKKVAIYQFSARELGFGDWRRVSLVPLSKGR
ncbi:MAG: hypothetical protein JRI68_35535, partial [Deltaproteobacteria bacterium]|nr:hypothetical protein [Deltaproteobacteria bacterium]